MSYWHKDTRSWPAGMWEKVTLASAELLSTRCCGRHIRDLYRCDLDGDVQFIEVARSPFAMPATAFFFSQTERRGAGLRPFHGE